MSYQCIHFVQDAGQLYVVHALVRVGLWFVWSQNMKMEADRAAVKHDDVVEDMLAKHSKELEDAGQLELSLLLFRVNTSSNVHLI